MCFVLMHPTGHVCVGKGHEQQMSYIFVHDADARGMYSIELQLQYNQAYQLKDRTSMKVMDVCMHILLNSVKTEMFAPQNFCATEGSVYFLLTATVRLFLTLGSLFILLYIKNIFHADKTFYNPCPTLEGIKDALCKHSDLVRTVEPYAQTWWSWKCVFHECQHEAQALALMSEATEALAKREAR